MKNGARAERGGRKRELPVLITGGCGFIGANLANRLLESGQTVVAFDNFSRPGVERNYRWLRQKHGSLFSLQVGDTRDAETLAEAVANASAVYHFAAQVAVTTSLERPREDFEINAGGTFNVLEAMRGLQEPPPLLFTSTNKVYGSLEEIELRVSANRYQAVDLDLHARGVDEMQRLSFYSPYGCSKGTADQYVLDYARSYGIPAAVFRMSCIYGPHQFGTEDQGWVAHFLIRAIEEQPITLFGDGRQVRDLLYIDDLVAALLLARDQMGILQGEAFNIGGGMANSASLLELTELVAELTGSEPALNWGPSRAGDQRFYVTDFSKFRTLTGWEPKVNWREGVGRLHCWLQDAYQAEVLAFQ